MRFSIQGPIRLKKEGDEPVSEQLKRMVLEKSKEIKLTVPFQASGTFSKSPLQPDGITPVIVESADFGIKKEVKSETKEQPKIVEIKTKLKSKNKK